MLAAIFTSRLSRCHYKYLRRFPSWTVALFALRKNLLDTYKPSSSEWTRDSSVFSQQHRCVETWNTGNACVWLDLIRPQHAIAITIHQVKADLLGCDKPGTFLICSWLSSEKEFNKWVEEVNVTNVQWTEKTHIHLHIYMHMQIQVMGTYIIT